MNIVVLGKRGKLGSDLIELLTKQNIPHKGCAHHECDITNRIEIERTIKDNVTHVINCAAYTHVDGCEDNYDKAVQINTEAPKLLAQICSNYNIHLTHISTDYVFDGETTEPYDENDETHPISAYGKTKLDGELYVKLMQQQGLIVRTSWLYGKNGKNFIDTAISKLQNKTPVKAVKDSFGSPTYSIDLSESIIKLILNNRFGVYHVCNKGQCSWYDFTKKAADLLNLNTSYIIGVKSDELNRKAIRPNYSAMSTEKLEIAIQESTKTWQDGLKRFLIETGRL